MRDEKMMRCCICGKRIDSRESNDAWPVDDGRCCHECNMDVVVPARLKMLSPKAYLHSPDLYSEDEEVYDEGYEEDFDPDGYCPSSTAGDYSPSNPWDAPGMSIRDFI